MIRRALAAGILVIAAALTGCAATTGADTTPTPIAAERVPGSTLAPDAVTVDPAEGQVLAVVAAADRGDEEQAVLDAVERYAAAHAGTVIVCDDASRVDAVSAALAAEPDAVVGVGPAVVAAIDRASASNLDVPFLVLGTQLAEPTGNVVAVVWPGADERAVFADEELPFAGAAEYADAAVEAGLGAFASDLSGHVIDLG